MSESPKPPFPPQDRYDLYKGIVGILEACEAAQNRLPHGSDAWEVAHRLAELAWNVLDAVEPSDASADVALDLIPVTP